MLIRAFTYEYLLLGAATAIFALVAGGGVAWYVLSRIMKLPSNFLPDVALMTLVIALVTTIGIGSGRHLAHPSDRRPHPCCASSESGFIYQGAQR